MPADTSLLVQPVVSVVPYQSTDVLVPTEACGGPHVPVGGIERVGDGRMTQPVRRHGALEPGPNWEAPDTGSMAAVAMAISGGGALSKLETTELLTVEACAAVTQPVRR